MSEVQELSTMPRDAVAGRSWPRTAVRVAVPWMPYVLAFLLAFGAYWGAARKLNLQGPTGDEPSYFFDAFSMARDGDRNLSNQFDVNNLAPQVKLFGVPAVPHGQVWVKGHGYITWHGAGLGFALVPGVWIGDALGDPVTWMRLDLIFFAALAAALLLALLRRLGSVLGCRQVYVWLAWLSSAACLEVVAYADRFYPEMLALFCVLAAANVAAVRRPGWRLLVAGSVAASFLPWLHIRFIPICFGLLGVLAVRGLAAAARPAERGWLWPTRSEIAATLRVARTRTGVGILAAVAVPAIASFAYMAFEFNRWYGSPSWTAMTQPGPSGNQAWYYNVVGGLFASDYGWLPYAPVFVIALAGIGCLWLAAPRWTTVALVIAAGYHYVLGKSGLNTPGFAFPGRYEVVCLPLLACAVLVVIVRVKVAWIAFVPLLLLSLAITRQASQNTGNLLLNTGLVGLPMVQHLESAFPDVERPQAGSAFAVDQPTQIHTVGRVMGGPDQLAVAKPSDGPGYLTAGPGLQLAPGTYIATFTVGQKGARGQAPFGRLEIWSQPGLLMATRELRATDVKPGGLRTIEVPFGTPGPLGIETRAFVNGRATVQLGHIDVRPTYVAPVPGADAHPDAALMAAWLFGEIFLGALFFSVMRSRRRASPNAS